MWAVHEKTPFHAMYFAGELGAADMLCLPDGPYWFGTDGGAQAASRSGNNNNLAFRAAINMRLHRENICAADKPVSNQAASYSRIRSSPRAPGSVLLLVAPCSWLSRCWRSNNGIRFCASVNASPAPAILAPLVSVVCWWACQDPCRAPCPGLMQSMRTWQPNWPWSRRE